jgi:hypothetical protein
LRQWVVWAKLKVLQLNLSLKNAPEPTAFNAPQKQSTLDFLREFGYSDTIIARFFKPFFRGVFLENGTTIEAEKIILATNANQKILVPRPAIKV